MRERAAACSERNNAPERPCKSFQIRRRPVEDRASRTEAHTGAAFGKIRQERLEEIDDGLGEVVAGLQRIAEERIGPGGIIYHCQARNS